MPSRLVLMGAKEGAWCAIDTVRRPMLRINGLLSGVIDFEVITESREILLGGISADGDYDLRDWFPPTNDVFFWIRVRATEPTPSLVCLVVPKKKAA